jgi:uncharacterized membrane protein YdfJ with MMPL/SSD domain
MTYQEYSDAMDQHETKMDAIATRMEKAQSYSGMDHSPKFQKKLLWVQSIVLLLLIVYVIFFYKPKGQNGEVVVPFKQHMEILNSEIKQIRDQQKSDSLDRMVIVRQIDTLYQERQRINQDIKAANQKLQSVKQEYEKINARYNDVSADSLSRLFAERFGK